MAGNDPFDPDQLMLELDIDDPVEEPEIVLTDAHYAWINTVIHAKEEMLAKIKNIRELAPDVSLKLCDGASEYFADGFSLLEKAVNPKIRKD